MEILYSTKKYFKNEPATVYKGKYSDGSTALILQDHEVGERLAVATVCMVDYDEKPEEGNVFIKDYSENEGTLDCLIEQGVVSEPVREVQCGPYAVVYECKLIGEPKELFA